MQVVICKTTTKVPLSILLLLVFVFWALLLGFIVVDQELWNAGASSALPPRRLLDREINVSLRSGQDTAIAVTQQQGKQNTSLDQKGVWRGHIASSNNTNGTAGVGGHESNSTLAATNHHKRPLSQEELKRKKARNQADDYFRKLEKNSTHSLAALGPHKYRQAKALCYRKFAEYSTTNLTLGDAVELSQHVLNKFSGRRVITVRGFYSSGTNWLRALIKRNCMNEVIHDVDLEPPFMPKTEMDSDGLYGWKHGFFTEFDKKRFLKEPEHHLFWIVREAPTWLVSAWRMNANGDETRKRFPAAMLQKLMLRGRRFRKVDDYLSMTLGNNPGTANSAFQDMLLHVEGNRDEYKLVAENVLKARDIVQKHWAKTLRDLGPNRSYFIRYEDLLADPKAVFNDALRAVNVTCMNATEAFDSVKARVKYGALDKKLSPQQRHPRGEFCFAVQTDAFYQHVLSFVDLEFEERELGYTYPATRDEYCANVPASDYEYYKERDYNESSKPPSSRPPHAAPNIQLYVHPKMAQAGSKRTVPLPARAKYA